MTLLSSLFARRDDRAALRPLYDAVIARARAPHWYLEGDVPDSIDGRFDMVAAILSLVLIRMDALDLKGETAKLTELFIDDMEGQVRQIGFGDLIVGKQVGRMVGALGGRMAAYRAGLAGEAPLGAALVRNLYRGAAPAPAPLAHTESRLRAFAAALESVDARGLFAGRLPD